ncbi:MAG: CsiV family protein [Steroidobacterales bacterium]
MPPRSDPLRRITLLFLIALIAPIGALAQTAAIQASSPGAAQSPRAMPAPGAPAQTAPVMPSQATRGQPQATVAKPASTAASSGPAATPPAPTTQPQPAPAHSGPAYDIEIVIFRAKVGLGQSESWATETTAAATVAGGEASGGSGPVGKLLALLPGSDYRLTALESRLRKSGTYLPVAHAAWVQTASAWGTHAGFPLASLGINVPGLTGDIFLERGQFLHLGMTLDYAMQDPPSGLNAPPGTTFVLNETRRVRFYQRNYYDHPAFGVIALITPARGRRPPGR